MSSPAPFSVASMRPLGYLYKRVARRPQWLKAPHVEDIYSLSGCISHPFADYIKHWKHNGYWLFDSPAVIKRLAAEHSIALAGLRLFYYEAYEQEFEDQKRGWARCEVPIGCFCSLGLSLGNWKVRPKPLSRGTQPNEHAQECPTDVRASNRNGSGHS